MANKELIVIEKAKDLGDYLFQVTNNSPKKFRFTFVSRMQNLVLDLIENLYRANSVRVNEENKQAALKRRKAYQREAKVSLDILCYVAFPIPHCGRTHAGGSGRRNLVLLPAFGSPVPISHKKHIWNMKQYMNSKTFSGRTWRPGRGKPTSKKCCALK